MPRSSSVFFSSSSTSSRPVKNGFSGSGTVKSCLGDVLTGLLEDGDFLSSVGIARTFSATGVAVRAGWLVTRRKNLS